MTQARALYTAPESKDRFTAGPDDITHHPVVHTSSYKIYKAA
jgi:hypothetical protein